MPDSLLLAIFIVFVVHFIVFLRLSLLRRKLQHILAATSFFLLMMFSSLRLWAPRVMLHGYPVYMYFRVSAWCTSALTLAVFIRNKGKG